MYQRVLIPKEDQERPPAYMEEFGDGEREPDVDVLAFGDKPAPAMGQTALRKTANKTVETHPEAAKTLLGNSYVDDI